MIYKKNQDEIARIRAANQIVAGALSDIEEILSPGVTTAEIDARIDRFIRDSGGTPAFLGYHGFPASSCISVNDEVVHGIPSKKRALEDGDIVGIDVGVNLDGYFGDSARTFGIGTISEEDRRLLDTTQAALDAGIEAAKPGGRVGDVSAAVQRVAESAGFSVVRTLVGHGVGKHLHEEPAVPNFGRAGDGPKLEVGMVIAIEPMVNAGKREVRTLDDGWTIVTEDGSRSAHFEHSVAITDDGPDVLSLLVVRPAAEGRG